MPKRRKKRERVVLTEEEILEWADWFYECHGRWPHVKDGVIPRGVGRTWNAVDNALTNGRLGLPGGSSLTQLLTAKRGHRNPRRLPILTEQQILAWADDYFLRTYQRPWANSHHQRTGKWPTSLSGPILDAEEGQTWLSVARALGAGRRGLQGGSSLSKLLRERCPVES